MIHLFKSPAGSLLLLLMTFFGMLNAQGQTRYEVSLLEAQEIALQKAFAMQYAALDHSTAERDVKVWLANGMPQVNLVADYSQYIDIPTQVVPADAFGFPSYLTEFLGDVSEFTGVSLDTPPVDPDALSELQFGQNHSANVGIQASQMIFSGSFFVGLKAAQLYVESRDQALLRTADEVRKQVAEAYHLVLGAVEGKGILENALALVKESFAETQQLKAEGFVNQVAVDQLELAVQELELELATAGKQVGLTMSLLRFQMGIHPTKELLLTQSLADLMSENNGLELLSQPFNSSLLPGLEEQRAYVELAGLNVKNQQAMGWPEISAFYTNQGNAQRDAFNFLQSDGNWYPVQLWGINFSMPLWTSFSGRHQVEQKKIKEERAQVGLEQMEHAAMMEFDHARTNLVQAMGAFQNRTRAVELAQRIYDQTQLAFKEGVVSSFEWTQSRNQLIEAQGNLLGASLDWLNAQVRLQAALSKFE